MASLSASEKSQTAESSSAQETSRVETRARTASEEEEEESEGPNLYDLRSAYKDLIIAPQVTHEDIVSVHGKVRLL